MIDDTPQSMAADLHKRMARMDISDDLEPTPQTARGWLCFSELTNRRAFETIFMLTVLGHVRIWPGNPKA